MGMHRRAPQPSLSELAGVEVAAVEEATVGAQDDLDAFVATLRRCARSLATFGATMRFLEDVGRWRRGGEASLVARWLQDCSRWFEAAGRMNGMQGTCGICWGCANCS